ncbi:hypothetical protein SGLAM104S_03299 [Streptomyces glaucescens]
MTSGRAISHSGESPRPRARFLHGAQLSVALPDAHRHTDPHFEHHADLPLVTAPGLTATLILGDLDGATSPGTAYTPIVGADLALTHGADVRLPLEPDFEYAVLAMSGEAHVDGVPVLPGSLLYLGCGRRRAPLRARLGRRPDAARRRAVRRGTDHVLELDRTLAGGDRTRAAGLDGRDAVRGGEGVRRGSTARPPNCRRRR